MSRPTQYKSFWRRPLQAKLHIHIITKKNRLTFTESFKSLKLTQISLMPLLSTILASMCLHPTVTAKSRHNRLTIMVVQYSACKLLSDAGL